MGKLRESANTMNALVPKPICNPSGCMYCNKTLMMNSAHAKSNLIIQFGFATAEQLIPFAVESECLYGLPTKSLDLVKFFLVSLIIFYLNTYAK
jgi:hypothetical protein